MSTRFANRVAGRNARKKPKKIDEGFIEAGIEWMEDLTKWLDWVERRLKAYQEAFEKGKVPKWEDPPCRRVRAGGTAPPPPWGKSR